MSGRIIHGDATPEHFGEDCPCYAGRALACPIHGPASHYRPGGTKHHEGNAGTKDDAGKPRMDLLPFAALAECAHVLTFGAQKYGERNWHGLSVSRLFAASLRHLWVWWLGEDDDAETGRSHLAHAACCVLMALEQTMQRARYDDRPVTSGPVCACGPEAPARLIGKEAYCNVCDRQLRPQP